MVLLACLISAGNAFIRYGFSGGSNAWLEVQWHLFAGMVMLGSAWTLARNGHVRVDVFYGRWKPRTQAWMDLFGFAVFLMPVCLWLLMHTWPLFATAWSSGEVSANAGGLSLWPAKLMLPLGFGCLVLQGIAEIIKRIAWAATDCSLETALSNERMGQREACRTEDFVEGVTAFAAKRAPEFKGR